MKKIIFILLAMLSFTFGCSKSVEYAEDDASFLRFDDTITSESIHLSGGGYNVEPPAFRDMSNIYGEITQATVTSNSESTSWRGTGFNPEGSPNNPAYADMTNPSNVERKLVKRANIGIRVENLEATDAFISDLMKRYGAYSALTQIVEESSYRYSLRVPSPVYDAFLGEMVGVGRILHRNETTEDVTVNYYDLEGRLATKRELLRTYQTYLGRAANITELLSVESKIADLQYDIERTGTQLRNLANLVDYATIDLNLVGPVTMSPSTPHKKSTFGEQVKMLFGDFVGFLISLVLVITNIILYGIPILLFVLLFYWVLFGRIGLMKKLWRIAAKKQE